MKKIFGFYNGCYWLMIMSLEELNKNLSRINHLREQIPQFKEILKSGNTIFVNRAGGWHIGDIEEKRDLIACDEFPTPQERVIYLKAKAEVEIDCACADIGMTREEVLNY